MRQTIVAASFAALLTVIPLGKAVQLSGSSGQSSSSTTQHEHADAQKPSAKPTQQDMARMHEQMMSGMMMKR